MKKFAKITALVLTVAMLLSFAGCSSYGKLEKAFEKEGYKVAEDLDKAAEAIKTKLNKENDEKFPIEFHVLTSTAPISVVIIAEFSATKDMIEFCKNSETAKGLIKDIAKNDDAKAIYNKLKDAGFVKGNCIVIPVLNAGRIREIVKNA